VDITILEVEKRENFLLFYYVDITILEVEKRGNF